MAARLLALTLAAVVLIFAADRTLHRDQVLRGVTIGGEDLAGLDRQQAREALLVLEQRLAATRVLAAVRDARYEVTAADLGFALMDDELVDEAFAAGRQGNVLSQLGWWLSRAASSHRVVPRGRVDAERLDALLAEWASSAIEDPPFEGAITVVHGKPRAAPPRPGWVIDAAGAREALAAALASGESGITVELPLVERQPERTAAQLEQALKRAEALVAGPVVLVAERDDSAALDDKAWLKQKKQGGANTEKVEVRVELSTELLASALRIRSSGDAGLELDFDPAALEPALEEARAALESDPVDARFVIDERDEVHIRPSRPARVIDAAQVAARVREAASRPEREAVLPVADGAKPPFSTADAEALGIRGLVSQFTTRHPCCRPRVKNIHKMAELIDGVLLAPGERFSINERVGPRTTAKGFVAAPTIVHGKMKDTIGGGVSQFATTFFNAAFYGGYEIIERQPHSFYFRRYPMGHEATLSYPKPDVIIRNDTEAGLLIRCIYTGTSLTIKLFGDNNGRTVKRKISRPMDLTDPPIEYIPDRKLRPDKEKVKERGQKGWSVIVGRVTTYADGREKTEQRKVTYRPRVRKVRVHPCNIPKGEKGYTGEPCPELDEDDDEDSAEVENVPAILGPGELQAGPEVDPELTPEG